MATGSKIQRLFVAVNFSPEMRSALLGAIASLRSQARRGSFTRPENLHMTLAFIGETDNAAAAKEAVGAVSGRRFDIALSGWGRFGELYWAGVEENRELETLAASVCAQLRERGFDIEKRKFRPHITLARRVDTTGRLKLSVPHAEMEVRRISLMKSERVNGRLTYTEIFSKALE